MLAKSPERVFSSLPMTFSRGWLLVPGVLVACGAGSAAEAVRPEAPSAAKALDEGECRDVGKGGEPLVVDWKPEQRGDLEVAMKDGIAIVSYSCKGIQILTECKLDGDYGYIGMTRREQVVRLQNADEVRANLPLSGVAIAAELERGSSLDIAMILVGKRRTTWDAPAVEDLKGSCDGATHFVRGATVGAFAMTTGSQAKARAAAEIFGAGTEGASSSAKQTQNRDGAVTDCQKATPDSDKAPDQCGAPIRLVLSPLAKGRAGAAAEPVAKKPEAVEKSECPSGLVFSEGKCTTPAEATAYECEPGNVSQCTAQCDKGNAASCGNLGSALLSKGERGPATAALKKGCDGTHMRSCALLGTSIANGSASVPGATAAALLQKSCDGGEALGCKELGKLYLAGSADTPKDEAKSSTLLRQACDGADDEACALFAAQLERGQGGARDPMKAAQLYKRACDGGHIAACASAGKLFEFGPMRNPVLASMVYQRGCMRGSGEACSGWGRTQFERSPDSAKRSFEMACNFRDPLGCAALKVLFGSNRPFVPDPRAQMALQDACRRGSDADCVSTGLLDTARGLPAGKIDLQRACTRGSAFACAALKKTQ
ncbi:MAG TPA: tetratricopeptide repeat protein [Polyangiaceae bacterium]|nr:tetratricopeptide repeat protein [Polyangiaceae bacterium]